MDYDKYAKYEKYYGKYDKWDEFRFRWDGELLKHTEKPELVESKSDADMNAMT